MALIPSRRAVAGYVAGTTLTLAGASMAYAGQPPRMGAPLSDTSSADTTPSTNTVNHDALQAVRDGNLVLMSGSKGHAVSSLQVLLGIPADGDFGPQTAKAVKSFQSEMHLAPDGKVGQLTLRHLESRHAESFGEATLPDANIASLSHVRTGNYATLSRGHTGKVVSALKEALNTLGYTPKLDTTNLTFDAWTENAVRAFQSDTLKKYPHLQRMYRDKSTGVVTPTTWYWLDVALEQKSSGFNAVREWWTSHFAREDAPIGPITKATFHRALEMTLRFEGGLNSDPRDRGNRGGNVTLYGLTQAAVNAYCKQTKRPPVNLRSGNLPPHFVEDFYYDQYWRACEHLQLPECLAISFFDCRVLFGPRGAACLLQRALGVPADGKIGNATIAALRAQDPVEATQALSVSAQEFIDRLVSSRPQNAAFAEGWRRRAFDRNRYAGILPFERPPLKATVRLGESDAMLRAADVRHEIALIQKQHGLKQTGEVDAALFAALMDVDGNFAKAGAPVSQRD